MALAPLCFKLSVNISTLEKLRILRVERGILLGSIEYWACPVMEKSAVARMAAEILNEGISKILLEFGERIEESIKALEETNVSYLHYRYSTKSRERPVNSLEIMGRLETAARGPIPFC